MAKASHKAYVGPRRKIVLAFDLGTTYSGISYSILDPGQIPGINGVTRFPAQETISGASKIPTIIYYDRQGVVKAVGAEATKDGIFEAAQENGWYKSEWFKLHLRSKYGAGQTLHPNVVPLPPNKSVVDVIADFLRYLLECAATYIRDTHPNGDNLWNVLKDDIDYVLSHPNGWEGKEQNQMRQAAVKAGLIPDTMDGHARVTFVTEGEASLHFAIENGVITQIPQGEGIAVVDAGGGTIDICTYRPGVSHEGKKMFEEIAIARCYFHGSVFVTFQAKDFIKELLSDSPYLDDLEHICSCFDKATKPRFRNATDPQYIKFGATRDNDALCGIRFGQLKVAGSDVAKFFQPSIECILEAIREQEQSAPHKISHVILVGGFAASDWLFANVKSLLKARGLAVVRPENHVNKAVSDGAISFYLNHYVRTRVTKATYGSKVSVPYNSSNPEHVKRAATLITDVDGTLLLTNGFSIILKKNTQVSETKEFTRRLTWYFSDPAKVTQMESMIMCYRGDDENPEWIEKDSGNFGHVCTLIGDLSRVPRIPKRNPSGKFCYSISFDVVLNFGLTELKAQLRWYENRVERRSPAKLIYDA